MLSCRNKYLSICYVFFLLFVQIDSLNLISYRIDIEYFIISKESKTSLENGATHEAEDDNKGGNDYEQLKSDYEDLLVLLEDQDAKINRYKVCMLCCFSTLVQKPSKGVGQVFFYLCFFMRFIISLVLKSILGLARSMIRSLLD